MHRFKIRTSTLITYLIGLGVVLSVISLVAVGYKVGTDRRQDSQINEVRVRVDKETRARVTALEQQRAIDRAQDKIQSAQIASNRKLLIAILKLRDKNPELFEGIDLPTTAGFTSQTRERDKAKAAVPTPTKPKPVKPKPGSTPTPVKPEPTQPTPTPQPPVNPQPPTPLPPLPGVPSPNPQPPLIPVPPIIGPLLPPILGPVIGPSVSRTTSPLRYHNGRWTLPTISTSCSPGLPPLVGA